MQRLAEIDHHGVLQVLAILLRVVIWEIIGSFSEFMIAAAIFKNVVSNAGVKGCGGGADAIGFVPSVAQRIVIAKFRVDEILSLLERRGVLKILGNLFSRRELRVWNWKWVG
jgi:hypothetical protein